MPRGNGADEDAESGNGGAHGDPVVRGLGEEPVEDRDGIADAHAPAHPEFSGLGGDEFV